MTDTTINVCIAVAMMFMAMCLALLVSALHTVLVKGVDTLGAVQRLCDTLQQEVQPTAVQLREVMDGIQQLKGVTTQRISDVTHTVENVAESVNTVMGQTKKQSTVFGTGVLAGIQEYLFGKHDGHAGDRDKRITMDRGERHELKQ